MVKESLLHGPSKRQKREHVDSASIIEGDNDSWFEPSSYETVTEKSSLAEPLVDGLS